MSNFIFDEEFNQWFSINGAIFHCRFSVETYQDSLFDDYKIKCHKSLQNAVTKRRAEFLAGRYCAQRVLTKMGYIDTEIGIGKHRNPLWPCGVAGAISHAKSLAISVAVNANAYLGVGVDVEEVVSEKVAEQLEDKIYTCQEKDIVQAVMGSSERSFTLAFSMKESFFKSAFESVGRYFDFNAVSIDAIDPEKRSVELVVTEDLSQSFHKGKRIEGQYIQVEGGMIATQISVPVPV